MGLKTWARQLKGQVLTAYYAARDPRTPVVARLLAFAIAAYALSPVDLIPDFVPVIGYLDDLIIVPIGLALVIRLIPDEVLAAARAKAAVQVDRPVSYGAAVFIGTLWLIAVALLVYIIST